MSSTLAGGNEHVCCPLCNCLGYCVKRNHDAPHHAVLSERSLGDFKTSAIQGCRFCDVVSQSSVLLESVELGTQVELTLYLRSPTELYSLANKDVVDVVEIYPNHADMNYSYPKLGKDVPQTSSLEASVCFLRDSYYSCFTSHTECHQEEMFLPKRIVDISQTRYRLFEPLAGTKDRYATLSYTWGAKGFAMTTSSNYEELKVGFDQKQLPIVFQDAAALVRSLDIRYLWIDTLCIIQDSPADWEEQAAMMGEIYEGAAITIAASSSSDPHHTLFKARKPMYQEIELYSKVGEDTFDVLFKARRKIARGIHAKIGRTVDPDPLDTRAWGLQEKMLSTRLVAFTGAEIQWTCKTLKACECRKNPNQSKPLFPAPTWNLNADKILRCASIWSQIIEEYSGRELTVIEDKLPALSGLACKFGAVTGFEYISGLWRETILYDLVWQRDITPLQVYPKWLGPSFSWISVAGAVNFRFARHSYPGSRIQHTKLLDFHYRTAGKDAYSKAADGSLTVQGHTVAAVLRKSSEEFPTYAICIDGVVYSPKTDQQAICEFSIDVSVPHCNSKTAADICGRVQFEKSLNDTSQKLEEPVTLLSLYSIYHRRYLYQNFLILARSQHDVNTYERVGIGSGKLYRGSGNEADIPNEACLVRPFEWLSVDLEKNGHGIGSTVERAMCIR